MKKSKNTAKPKPAKKVVEKPDPKMQAQAKVEKVIANKYAKSTEAIEKVDLMKLDDAGQMEAIFRSAPDAIAKVVGKPYHDDYKVIRAKTNDKT